MPKHNLDKNTVIGHVQTEDRLNEIATLCNERGLKFIIGLEPDKPEDISDIERRLNPPSPHFAIHIGRNEPCPCGSEKKIQEVLWKIKQGTSVGLCNLCLGRN